MDVHVRENLGHAPHFMASCGENGNKPLDLENLGQLPDFGTDHVSLDEVDSTI